METHGNAIGIGSADFTTARLVKSIDQKVTAINALTALSVQSAKIPIHFDTDREAIDAALDTLALKDRREAKVLRIVNTLSLENVQISEGLSKGSPVGQIRPVADAADFKFDSSGNLVEMN